MPLTNAGRNRLLTSGVEFAFVQFSTQAVADAAIPGLTALAGVQATVAVDQLIVGPETNWTGVDREPTRDYRGVRTAGVWDRDPTAAGAVLLAVEHTPSMPDKVLNQSLRISGSLLLTNDQAANITRNVLQVGGADEANFGLVRLGTQAEAQAAAPPADRVGTLARVLQLVNAWWGRTTVPVSKITGLAGMLATYATNAALTALTGRVTGAEGRVTAAEGRITTIERNLAGVASVPTGTMHEFGGTVAPRGYLLCNGQAESRTTYSALFAAIGTRFGAGDGSTTFNVPDFRRRVAVGSGGAQVSGPGTSVGDSGGAETHTLSGREIPSHSHDIDSRQSSTRAPTGTRVAQTGDTTAQRNIGTGNVGGGQPHNNMQPSLVVTKIIKA